MFNYTKLASKPQLNQFLSIYRYRRSLKALEEGIEEIPEVVPKIQKSESPRIVPPNTAIELVMFCGRIYDFRKKLTKTPP